MISAVTAYVPIQGHPRSEEEYRRLGLELLGVNIPMLFRTDDLEDCWLFQYLNERGKDFTYSVADNPDKNSVAYHIVQAQKSEWLLEAAEDNPQLDVLVWIDYGIFSVPGVTAKIIYDFVQRAQTAQAITIPGCWGTDYKYDDSQPCWRFCGGVIVMPRQYAAAFDAAMKREYIRWIEQTNNLSWEVNTLARLEKVEKDLPIWHYKADHDKTMFTAYQTETPRIYLN